MSRSNGIKDKRAYCPEHTPLLIKNALDRAEEKDRRAIRKLGRDLAQMKLGLNLMQLDLSSLELVPKKQEA
jgi:hypothetical protein